MIEQTILTALATTFVMQLPAYQRLVKPRYKETSLRITTGREEYNQARDYFGSSYKGQSLYIKELPKIYDPSYDDDPFYTGTGRYEFIATRQINPFNRKPFTCAFCMGFWFGILFGGLSFILLQHPVGLFEAFAIVIQSASSSILAEAFARLYKLIPIKL